MMTPFEYVFKFSFCSERCPSSFLRKMLREGRAKNNDQISVKKWKFLLQKRVNFKVEEKDDLLRKTIQKIGSAQRNAPLKFWQWDPEAGGWCEPKKEWPCFSDEVNESFHNSQKRVHCSYLLRKKRFFIFDWDPPREWCETRNDHVEKLRPMVVDIDRTFIFSDWAHVISNILCKVCRLTSFSLVFRPPALNSPLESDSIHVFHAPMTLTSMHTATPPLPLSSESHCQRLPCEP